MYSCYNQYVSTVFDFVMSESRSGQVVHLLSVTMNPVPPVAWVGISATKPITLTSPRCEEDD